MLIYGYLFVIFLLSKYIITSYFCDIYFINYHVLLDSQWAGWTREKRWGVWPTTPPSTRSWTSSPSWMYNVSINIYLLFYTHLSYSFIIIPPRFSIVSKNIYLLFYTHLSYLFIIIPPRFSIVSKNVYLLFYAHLSYLFIIIIPRL